MAAIKRAGQFGRVGHAGTLDPLADGVLPIAVGGATRMVDFLHLKPKRYLAMVMFGVATDTNDLGGQVIAQSVQTPGISVLRNALATLVNRRLQRPPIYSAIKVGGRRAYQLSRRGAPPELPERKVSIYHMSILDVSWWDGDDLSSAGLTHLVAPQGNRGRLVVAIDVSCGSGTYVRSIARDLGEETGTLACLAGLTRMSVGPFTLDNSLCLNDALRAIKGDYLSAIAYPPDEVVLNYPGTVLGPRNGQRFLNGISVDSCVLANDVRVYNSVGSFLGLGRSAEDGLLRPRIVMAGQVGLLG